MRIFQPRGGMRRTRGFSLLELMTALTIGLLLLAGLATVFSNSSNSNKEMKRTSEQIENGRYAIELLTQDFRHAGFYGQFAKLPAAPASAPDPCTVPTDGAVSDTQNNALALAVQIFPAASFSAMPSPSTNCATLLTSANLIAGSDIVVVRRADTVPLGTSVTGGTYYIQATPSSADIQLGVAGTITNTQNARGQASTLTRRDLTAAATGSPAAYPQIGAEIRRYRTDIYFVAPCSVPTGGGAVCTGGTDDQGKPIPTLKRIELDATGAFSIVPLAEGIQALRAEFGVDSAPIWPTDPGTGSLVGDGVPDSFTHSPSVTDMSNTVAVRLYVLARNTEMSTGYVDDKTYTLGSATTTATNDAYKRHVYGAETRIVNQSGRREIPN
jgi:type IV pilus assembly protein PilW